MGEIKRWSGNATTEISLYDNELDQLVEFVNAHGEIYIYGKGRIGTALGHYCKQAGIHIDGYIISEEWETFKKKYNPYKTVIVMGVGDSSMEEIRAIIDPVVKLEDIFTLSSHKRESMGNVFSKKEIEEKFWINIYVTNHCNLNCASCSAFAPICKPDYYDVEQFQKDLKQIKKLQLTHITAFKFTGAEALLHPNIFEMFKIARREIKDGWVECYTNGIILLKMKDEQLQLIKGYNVTLVITEYPVEIINYEHVYKRLKDLGVKYEVIYSDGTKYFSQRPLNFDKSTAKHLFYYCPRYKMCNSLFLFNGRLYKCIYALSATYFNEAFATELEVMPQDYLDIYKISKEEVYQYCINRIPFCGYCSPIEKKVEWRLSERKIQEWT